VAADAAMVAVAVEVAAVLHVAAVEVAVALRVLSAALVPVAALELAVALRAVAGAVEVSVYTALEVSVYIADAHFSDAASAAVVVVAEAVGAAELAGYGRPAGAG
jgi:hypothetical protein